MEKWVVNLKESKDVYVGLGGQERKENFPV